MAKRNIAGGFRSGSLAKKTGLSADTIRYYERIGILPKAARSESGYRLYPESAAERVLVVQTALRLGFTLAELANALADRDTGAIPCRRVYEIGREKLKGIRSDIHDLKRMEKRLKTVLADWEVRIRKAAPGEKSHLLYSLCLAVKGSDEMKNRFWRKRKS